MHDVSLVGRNWDFDVERVNVPVSLWAGADDNFVPLVQQEALARVLPNVELHVIPDAGHCVLFQSGEKILADAIV
jgi:pimeloyl-ACP methyl ester carboxylesterase